MSDISDKILSLIHSSGLSYAELAAITRIPKSALQRYASGTTEKIPLDRLEQMATALGVSAAYLMGWGDAPEPSDYPVLTEAGERIGALYDVAGDRDKLVVETVLSPYEPQLKPRKVKRLPSRRSRRRDGFDEIEVYDEPAAAGLGNYLDAPASHKEQYPIGYIPEGAAFGVLISGDSMEPEIRSGATVFVQPAPALSSGEIGVFVLNGEAYCKRLTIDSEDRSVRLCSVNPRYPDITITRGDDLRTVGRVLASYPK